MYGLYTFVVSADGLVTAWLAPRLAGRAKAGVQWRDPALAP
jgi:hypothetical protein